jgi:UrcA family protein
MNPQNTRLFAAIVVATALLGASTASAAEWPPEHRTISLRGLDPATPAGAYRVYREIVQAANQVCGSASRRVASIAALNNRKDAQRCAEQAIASAVTAIDAAFGLDLEQLAGVKRSDVPAVAQTAER